MPRKESSYDPRKAQWNGQGISNYDPANWKLWKPKDKDYHANVEREFLRIKYSVSQVNK